MEIKGVFGTVPGRVKAVQVLVSVRITSLLEGRKVPGLRSSG